MTLKQFYDSWRGKARYTHPTIAAIVVAVFSVFTPWSYESAVSISVAYWWQEWGRQAMRETRTGRKIKWRAHVEQSVFPTLAAIIVYWLFKLV